ncbi:MAG: sialidase family protein, partial [Betaproteobacteria bacterium]
MIPNFRISGSPGNPRSESDIRVSPFDSRKIIAGANAINDAGQAQFFSSDGGGTWGQTTLPLHSGDSFSSDPCVDWTSDGTAWAITIGIDASQANLILRAYSSTDAGASWTFDGNVAGTQTNADKPMMWADHSSTSTFKDNIYATWHADAPVFVNRRTSAGWQTPVQVSGAETTGTGIGGDVKSNSAGDVFAFWPDTVSSTASDVPGRIFVAKSTDGGVTFGAPVKVADTFDSYDIGIPSFASRRALIYTSGGAFKTAGKDMAYVIWTDQASNPGTSGGQNNEPGGDVNSSLKTRIWFSRSTDGAATWSAPVMINDQSSKNDQFNPKLAVDEANGQLVVIYYDTVGDPGRKKTDVWMQVSDDDGATWQKAFKVTSAQTDEASGGDSGNQYGDYNGLSGVNGNFFPSWTDRRNGHDEEIWSAEVHTRKDAFFIVQRSTFGQDEVRAILGSPPSPAFIPQAFWVVVEGFTAAELGLSPGNFGNPPNPPTIAFSPAVSGMSVHCTGVDPEDPSQLDAPQRFRYAFEVIFFDDSAFNFMGDFEIVTLTASFSAIGIPVTANGQIELIKQANPYITNGETSWLSIDLRVFQVKAGEG